MIAVSRSYGGAAVRVPTKPALRSPGKRRLSRPERRDCRDLAVLILLGLVGLKRPMTVAEVAGALGCSVRTVHEAKARARAKAAEVLSWQRRRDDDAWG